MPKYVDKRGYMIIAVDFDGTLYEGTDQWPGMGKPNKTLINHLIYRKKQGDKIILWTSRGNANPEHNDLDKAVEWCKEQGLEFDAINDNLQEVKDTYLGFNTRKIVADVYIDDKALNAAAYLHHRATEEDIDEQVNLVRYYTGEYETKELKVKCPYCGHEDTLNGPKLAIRMDIHCPQCNKNFMFKPEEWQLV